MERKQKGGEERRSEGAKKSREREREGGKGDVTRETFIVCSGCRRREWGVGGGSGV